MTYFTEKELETLSTSQLDFVDTCKLSFELLKRTFVQVILIPFLIQAGLVLAVVVGIAISFFSEISQFADNSQNFAIMSSMENEQALFSFFSKFVGVAWTILFALIVIGIISSFISMRQIAVINDKKISNIFQTPFSYYKPVLTLILGSIAVGIAVLVVSAFGDNVSVKLIASLVSQILTIVVFFATCICLIDQIDPIDSLGNGINLFQANFGAIMTRTLPIALIVSVLSLSNFTILAMAIQAVIIVPNYVNFINTRLISAETNKDREEELVETDDEIERGKTVENGRVMEQNTETDQV